MRKAWPTVTSRDCCLALWQGAASVDPRVVPPGDEVLGRSPVWASRALAALSRSRYFAGIADRLLIGNLKQVHRYFTDTALRTRIRHAVADKLWMTRGWLSRTRWGRWSRTRCCALRVDPFQCRSSRLAPRWGCRTWSLSDFSPPPGRSARTPGVLARSGPGVDQPGRRRRRGRPGGGPSAALRPTTSGRSVCITACTPMTWPRT